MTKDRFYCLRQLACNARGDLELEAQDALAEIERLQQESVDRLNAGAHIARDRATLRQALEVCGRYLATLNSGGTAGYNASCRAVEEALGLDSLHQLKRPVHEPGESL